MININKYNQTLLIKLVITCFFEMPDYNPFVLGYLQPSNVEFKQKNLASLPHTWFVMGSNARTTISVTNDNGYFQMPGQHATSTCVLLTRNNKTYSTRDVPSRGTNICLNSLEKLFELACERQPRIIVILGGKTTIASWCEIKSPIFSFNAIVSYELRLSMEHMHSPINALLSETRVKIDMTIQRTLCEAKHAEMADDNHQYGKHATRIKSYLYFEPQSYDLMYIWRVLDLLLFGTVKETRSGTTISKFGDRKIRFYLDCDQIPVLNSKKFFLEKALAEAVWMFNGDTKLETLHKYNNKTWDANAKAKGYEKTIGPAYGHQIRHFGGEYEMEDGTKVGSGEGFDQIKYIYERLKNNPNARDAILSNWNCNVLDLVALPPCHTLTMFQINDGKLCAVLFQRSADIGLGVPFNIYAYATYIQMFARMLGVPPGHLTVDYGDFHIYQNHVDIIIKEQVHGDDMYIPVVQTINDDAPTTPDGIWTVEHFTNSYVKSDHPYIKLEMSV